MINVYYWDKKPNFGDALGPLLLEHFLHLPIMRTDPLQADIAVVGSILHHLSEDYKGIILGCGSLYPDRDYTFFKARILSVRGPLTIGRVNWISSHRIGIGDPGLLADELVGDQDKTHHLGIVPHWSDTQLAKNPLFLKYKPLIIDVTQNPLEVIRQIGRCRKIVSSSLHGIILADAFGIPRRTEIPPTIVANPTLDGGTFKWEDYSASINLPFKIGVTQEADRNIIIERQHEIYDVLKEAKNLLERAKG